MRPMAMMPFSKSRRFVRSGRGLPHTLLFLELSRYEYSTVRSYWTDFCIYFSHPAHGSTPKAYGNCRNQASSAPPILWLHRFGGQPLGSATFTIVDFRIDATFPPQSVHHRHRVEDFRPLVKLRA